MRDAIKSSPRHFKAARRPIYAGDFRVRKFSIAVGLLVAFTLQACSSTAVKGTPVKELFPKVSEERIRAEARADSDAIASMSRVKENSVFTVVSGVPEYRIGPLDVLEITSRIGEETKTATVTVNNMGNISYSFIDDLHVAGLAPSQVDKLLTQKLLSYIRNPRIDVIVKEFNSKSATVLGEFALLRAGTGNRAESGRINLHGKDTLMDLVAMAGGFTEQADIRKTTLIRQGKAYTINLLDILEKADADKNVVIEDKDIVRLPKLPEIGERVYVLGEVANQGVYPLKNAQDLIGAIALAGNTTRLAVEENTLIVRRYEPGKEPAIMMANLKDVLRKGDLSQNIPLQDGDLVYVPRMLIGDINDWISNMTPLLDLLFYPGRYVDQYYTRDYIRVGP